MHCEHELDITRCEVCHEPVNPEAKKEMLKKHKDNIYRPGDEIDELDLLTDEQMSERRREIEQLFRQSE